MNVSPAVTLADWQTDRHLRVRAWTGLCVAAASIFLFVLDSGLIGFALVDIRAENPDVPLATTSWAATGFLVAVASLLLVGGRLADRYGRKRVYLIGMIGFGVGSLLTALAPTVSWLIAARVAQGMVGALLTSSALALVMPLFPAERHGTMIGTWAGVGSVAAILAPTLGPLLIAVSWRLPFALIAPLCFTIWLLGRRVLDEQIDPAANATVDRVSLVIGPISLGLLTLGLSRGGIWGWTSSTLLSCLACALMLLGVFVRRCQRSESPLVDTSLFHYPVFRANALAGGLQQIGFFTWWVTAPVIVGSLWGWTGRRTGLAIALGQVAAAVSAPIGGRWADRVGAKRPTLIGAGVVMVGGLYLMATASTEPAFWSVFVPATVVMGLGSGVCGSLTTGTALRELPSAALGSANSLLQLIRRVGGTLGIAVATAMIGDATGAAALSRSKRVWLMMVVAHLAMCAALVSARLDSSSSRPQPVRRAARTGAPSPRRRAAARS